MTDRFWTAVLFIPLLLFLCMVSPPKAKAAQHEVGVICCSHHVSHDKSLNEHNGGAFYKYTANDGYTLLAGTFKNSYYRQATFISGGKTWRLPHDFQFTLVAGLTTGYSRTASPFAMPTLSYQRVHLHAIPGKVYALSATILSW